MGSGMGSKNRIQERIRLARAAIRDIHTGVQMRNLRLHVTAPTAPPTTQNDGESGSPHLSHILLLTEQMEFLLSEVVVSWQDYLQEQTMQVRLELDKQRRVVMEQWMQLHPDEREDGPSGETAPKDS